jgi:hypothetical protein
VATLIPCMAKETKVPVRAIETNTSNKVKPAISVLQGEIFRMMGKLVTN